MASALFHLDLVTPAGAVAACEASYVEAPGEEGRLGILAGHQPCIIGLAAGRLNLRNASGGLESWDIGRGVMTVTPAAVTVLVPSAAPA
jgi:F-type H+-transporting ATPase subunit epsilon